MSQSQQRATWFGLVWYGMAWQAATSVSTSKQVRNTHLHKTEWCTSKAMVWVRYWSIFSFRFERCTWHSFTGLAFTWKWPSVGITVLSFFLYVTCGACECGIHARVTSTEELNPDFHPHMSIELQSRFQRILVFRPFGSETRERLGGCLSAALASPRCD